MEIYHCHPDTGEHLNTTSAELDPVETELSSKDVYLIPANATSETLPEVKEGFVACFINEEWIVREDLRGKTYWDTAGEHIVETLEPLPESTTLVPPTTQYQTFVGGAWTVTAEGLDRARSQQMALINTACETAIVSGFESSAMGTAHRYQSDRDDQTNLLGLVAADADLPLKCLPADGTDWAYLLHTTEQLKQVLRDGARHKLQLLQRCNDIKVRIKKAETLEAVLAEVWAEE